MTYKPVTPWYLEHFERMDRRRERYWLARMAAWIVIALVLALVCWRADAAEPVKETWLDDTAMIWLILFTAACGFAIGRALGFVIYVTYRALKGARRG